MTVYRRKPMVQDVEAVAFKDEVDEEGKLPLGVQKAVFNFDGRPQLKFFVQGPDGPQFLSPGDYVVMDLEENPNADVYVVDKERFEAEFEAVPQSEPEPIAEADLPPIDVVES